MTQAELTVDMSSVIAFKMVSFVLCFVCFIGFQSFTIIIRSKINQSNKLQKWPGAAVLCCIYKMLSLFAVVIKYFSHQQSLQRFVHGVLASRVAHAILFSKLKPMYSFGKWWKLEFSLICFVYRVVGVLKALWIFLSETINFLRKLHKTMPPKFYDRVMYIAPSSGNISLNFNMPFKFILRSFEVVFWCLEWECCTFWKIDGNSFKSTNTILQVSTFRILLRQLCLRRIHWDWRNSFNFNRENLT